MRAWIVCSTALLTLIGIGSPRFAGRSGHLLVVTIGLIVAVIVLQPVFAAIDQGRAEPFVPTRPRAPRATMPSQMAAIVDAFTERSGTDDFELVPLQLIRRVTTAATGRIVDHHHLHLGDIDDHPAIRQLVSPKMWALMRPAEPASRTAPSVPVLTFGDLDSLIDELERL
jgi:hypothetical protein